MPRLRKDDRKKYTRELLELKKQKIISTRDMGKIDLLWMYLSSDYFYYDILPKLRRISDIEYHYSIYDTIETFGEIKPSELLKHVSEDQIKWILEEIPKARASLEWLEKKLRQEIIDRSQRGGKK